MSVKPPTNTNEESMEFSAASAEFNAGSVKPPTLTFTAAAMSVEASFVVDEDGSVKPPTEA
ncbi:MAG TPA: hypothetical protein VKB38_04675 [Terracidiphilus sp.]|nr:hypothetical protein [Terracidiphilus sp.]